jgi:hypothetical protein
VHRILRHNSRFILFPADRPEWAALSAVKDLRPDKPLIDFDALAEIASGAYSPGKSTTSLIADILTALADNRNYRPCASVEMLFAVLRRTMLAVSQTEAAAADVPAAPDLLLSMAIKQASDKASSEVHKILTRYHQTEKLPADCIGPFQKALADIIADCADGGPAQGYFQYLRSHLPELSPEDYRNIYRTRFEYLADTAQTCFFNMMKRK